MLLGFNLVVYIRSVFIPSSATRMALLGVTASLPLITYSFSTMPLRLSMWLGYATSLLAFAYLVTVFVQKALGITVQGWATIMVALLFLGGIQLICLGIIGEYLGRIFTEIKPRPMYIVEELLGGDCKRKPISEPAGGRSTNVRPAMRAI